MTVKTQGQSKRADALEAQAKAQGIQWLGRDGGTWSLVGSKGPMHRRTIGQMKELLDSHEHDTVLSESDRNMMIEARKNATVTRVGDDPNPHRMIVADHYVLSPISPDGEPHPDSDEALAAAGIGLTTMVEPVLVGPNNYSEPFTAGDEELYLAEPGDNVLIDARTDNEIQGTVSKVDGDIVTVRATKVLLRGRPRLDFEGFIYYPFQNGTERPWGLTNCLEKVAK